MRNWCGSEFSFNNNKKSNILTHRIVEVANRTYHTNANYEYEDTSAETEWKEVELFCGGTIIHNHYIITSGMCCTDIAKSKTPNPKVLLGSDQLLRIAQNMTVHPFYKIGEDDESASRNDLCLIRIEKDLFYSGSEKLNTGPGGQKVISHAKKDNEIKLAMSVVLPQQCADCN